MLVLSTDSLKGYGLNRIFELTKEAGYDGVDIAVNFHEFDSVNSDYLQKLSKEYSLPIHAISAPSRISATKIKELVKLAKEVNAKVLILQPPKILDLKLASWLKKEVPKLREQENLSISLENAPEGKFLGFIPEHAMSNTQELKKFKHVTLDTSRIGEQQKDLMRAYASFHKYLVHVHLSNVHKGKKYDQPQEGILPLESFLTKLKIDKYPGAISIKVLPRHLKAGKDEKLLDELAKIKKFYEKYYVKGEGEVLDEETDNSDSESDSKKD